MLIISDWVRGALLLVIPGAAWLGLLRIETLYVIAILGGAAGLCFDVAYRAYLPALVGRTRLIDANSKLELSRSAAEVGGPGIAGFLIQWLSAPVAIFFNAVSFWFAALLLTSIRTPEADPPRADTHERATTALVAGFVLIARQPLLRALAGCLATIGLFNGMLEAIALLYLTHQHGITPGLLGLIFVGANVGFLIGALLPERLAQRLGSRRALMTGLACFALSDLVFALMTGPRGLVVALLLVAQFGFGLGYTVFNVIHVSVRQSHTPDAMQGRMHAVMVLAMQGLAPVGAIAGGMLGEWVGLRPTLILAACGELAALLWLYAAPIPALREADTTSV